jgi:hypothetical protein
VIGRHTTLVALGFALAACDSTAPRTVTGNWQGTAMASSSLFMFDADLLDAGETVTGSSTVISSTALHCGNDAFDITGARSGSVVTLSFACPGYTPFAFEGALSKDGRTLAGALNGSGFTNTPLHLNKS